MARIRTIKPEFWTDSDMMKLSIPARLFYVGLWNFADDNGVLDGDSDSLKAKVFPRDKVNVDKLISEIVSIGKAATYTTNGKPYVWLRNLKTHQIIDRPRKTFLPLPTTDQLKSVEINHRREGKGMEGKEEQSVEKQRASDLLEAWNNNCGGLAKATALSESRAEKCRNRLAERPLEQWVMIFSRMAKTPFLNGENGKKWRASFDWIIANDGNSLKVLEGKYDDWVKKPEAKPPLEISEKVK